MNMENIEFPHQLFPLCLRISKGEKSTKRFITKDKKYAINVMCFPEQFRVAVEIEKPGASHQK